MAKPILITERTLIQDRIEHARGWLVQNEKAGLADSVAAAKRLVALDPLTATPDDIATADRGHQIAAFCNSCCKDVRRAVTVGEELDYESRTATLCMPCLAEATALIHKTDDKS